MKRSKHTLSYYRLMTGDMGLLYPVGLQEVLPKDTFQHSTSVFLRFSPMAAPVMHPVTVRLHHFFVPHRLVWPEAEGGGWESFITGGSDGADAQTVPTELTQAAGKDLHDHFGLPLIAGAPVSALPTRCYNQIYNEWYRDQDLAVERLPTDTTIARIAWEKDYLTMARPWSQKGPAITLPLGSKVPIATDIGDNGNLDVWSTTNQQYQRQNSAGPDLQLSAVAGTEGNRLYADLAQTEGVSINEFRRAFALQRYAEARARYGSRYTEYLRYLGVNPSDARLQRPEYLGGGKTRVAMSEVLQTSNTTGTEEERFGVGDMYGHGIASMRSNAYRRTFEEHGYCMTLLSVRPKAMYTNGIERHFLRRDREEFWQKELEQIGQQEIWDGEIFLDATPNVGEMYSTFGYQDRYREYRESQNRIAGDFRTKIDYWHLARQFASKPVLNQSFTDCNPSKRIFNVQTDDTLWVAVQHRLVARRLVSRNATSKIM